MGMFTFLGDKEGFAVEGQEHLNGLLTLARAQTGRDIRVTALDIAGPRRFLRRRKILTQYTLYAAATNIHGKEVGGQYEVLESGSAHYIEACLRWLCNGYGLAFQLYVNDLASDVPDSTTYALARRTLHLAYAWNDHNFDAAHLLARQTAEEVGIHSAEEAEAWLEANAGPTVAADTTAPEETTTT